MSGTSASSYTYMMKLVSSIYCMFNGRILGREQHGQLDGIPKHTPLAEEDDQRCITCVMAVEQWRKVCNEKLAA